MLGKTAIFTAVETVALVAWLALTGRSGYGAVGILFVLLTVEHVLSYNFRNRRAAFDWSAFPGLAILGIAGFETLTWAAWLALVPTSHVVAAVVLVVGLLAGHGAELNVVRQFSPFTRYRDRLKRALDITGIEAGIGIGWLLLVRGGQPILGAGVLLGGLFVEHVLSGRKRLG